MMSTTDDIDPHAERALLAAAFRDPSVVYLAAGEFTFMDAFAEAVMDAMLDLVDAGQPISESSLTKALRASGKLDLVGGRRGLRRILRDVPEEDVERVLLDLRVTLAALPPVAAEPVVVEAVDVLDAEEVEDVPGVTIEVARCP